MQKGFSVILILVGLLILGGIGGGIYYFTQIKAVSTQEKKDLGAPVSSSVSQEEKQKIDLWIQTSGVNIYGDAKDMMYAGGTPLLDEKTGVRIDRYDYIVKKHPDRPWRAGNSN